MRMASFWKKACSLKKAPVLAALLLFAIPMLTFAIGTTPPGSSSQSIFSEMFMWLLSLFAYFAGAMGALMGYAIEETVVGAGKFVNDLSSIKDAWSIFRDLGNITLVFGFMTIGIATILDNASYGAKKALPKLLMVAVALNFSYFAAGFIIDTGNMFATQFYAQMYGGKLPSSFNPSTEPLSNAIMGATKSTTVYNTGGANLGLSSQSQQQLQTQANASGTNEASNHYIYTFFIGSIVFIILAFVFGAISLMLVSRFVILLFLLITSPVGFVGLADIPLISKFGKKWWRALTDQTLFAPALLLFLLVAVKFAQSNPFNVTAGFAKATQSHIIDAGGIAVLFLNFAVIIGFIIASLMIAKSLAGKAAGFATSTSGKAVFGGLGFAGRNTAGFLFQRASEHFRESNLSRVPIVGRRIASGLDRVATSSFDMRATKTVGSNLSNVAGSLGKPQSGGYRASEEAAKKAEEKYAKSLKITKSEKENLEGLKFMRDDHEKRLETREQEHKQGTKDLKKNQAAQLKSIDAEIAKKQKLANEARIPEAKKQHEQDIAALKSDREALVTSHESELKNLQETFEADQKSRERDLGEVKDMLNRYGKDGKTPDVFAQNQYAEKLASKNTAAVADTGYGAAIGAAVGTIAAPIVGSAVGAAVGGDLGKRFGKKFGSKWREEAAKSIRKEVKSSQENESDLLKKAVKEYMKKESAKTSKDAEKGEAPAEGS